ncbi:MAG: hypothetical protein ABIQ13_14315 [Pedococcus sp.]
MSDTPRNDSADDRGDDVYRDPTAPSDAPSYGPPSPSGAPEHTEQLSDGGDTQQVPTESSVPPPPPAPPAGGASQNPYASPPEGAEPQNPYASPPAYPSQGEVADQHGAPGTPAPPGYGQAPGYGQPPYGAPAGGSLGGSTIALLVVAGLLTIGGCGTGIPGLVFAIIAVTKKDQPSEMAKWTKWGWIAIAVTVVLAVLAIGALIGLAAVGGSTSQ